MTKPEPLHDLSVVEQTRLRPCGHGLTGRRVRSDLHMCPVDNCHAARRRVLDHAKIWKPERGAVDDQVLVAQVYGDPRTIAEDVAIYAAGFDAEFCVLPRLGFSFVVLARAADAALFRMVLADSPDAITEAEL